MGVSAQRSASGFVMSRGGMRCMRNIMCVPQTVKKGASWPSCRSSGKAVVMLN